MSENKALAGPCHAAQAAPAICRLGVPSLLWRQVVSSVMFKVPRWIQPSRKALGPLRAHDPRLAGLNFAAFPSQDAFSVSIVRIEGTEYQTEIWFLSMNLAISAGNTEARGGTR